MHIPNTHETQVVAECFKLVTESTNIAHRHIAQLVRKAYDKSGAPLGESDDSMWQWYKAGIAFLISPGQIRAIVSKVSSMN